MIDAGTGVGRLTERPELLDGVRRLDIILTHFHLDHVAGLAYLPGFRICEETTVWGPGRLLYDQPTLSLLGVVSHEPFHPVPLEDQAIEVRDLPAGEVELAGVRVQTRRQNRHSAPTLGLRFDDELAWITDTAYDAASAAFASGCRMLAHEAWYLAADPLNPQIHSSALQAAQVARDAEVERLLLIHLPPFTAGIEPLIAEAQSVMPCSDAARELAELAPLPG
jgi:ribonuclease BN (tRNA processing enzyme)